MRVLVVTNMYPDKWRASGIFVKKHVELMSQNWNIQSTIVYHGDSRRGLRYSIKKYLLFTLRSIKALVTEKYNLVHGHFVLPAGLLALLCGRLRRKKVFLTAHGGDIDILPKRNFVFRKITKYVLQHADTIIAVSHYLAGKIETDFGIPNSKIKVINMGIDTNLFSPGNPKMIRDRLDIPPDCFIVIYVGNLVKEKGVHYLLEAFSKAQKKVEKTLHLYLIGFGEEMSNLQQQSYQLRIDDCVSFLGKLSHDEVAMWMKAADVLVHPTLSESFGLVVAEALATNLPVIASNVGGIPELIQNGENGFLFQPGEVNEITKHLVILLSKPDIYAAIQSRARDDIIAFDVKNQVRQIVRLYQEFS